jgi:hypothetical protein
MAVDRRMSQTRYDAGPFNNAAWGDIAKELMRPARDGFVSPPLTEADKLANGLLYGDVNGLTFEGWVRRMMERQSELNQRSATLYLGLHTSGGGGK